MPSYSGAACLTRCGGTGWDMTALQSAVQWMWSCAEAASRCCDHSICCIRYTEDRDYIATLEVDWRLGSTATDRESCLTRIGSSSTTTSTLSDNEIGSSLGNLRMESDRHASNAVSSTAPRRLQYTHSSESAAVGGADDGSQQHRRPGTRPHT